MYSFNTQFPCELPDVITKDGFSYTGQDRVAVALSDGWVEAPNAPETTSLQYLTWSGTEWVVVDKPEDQIKQEAIAVVLANIVATDAEFKPRWFEDIAQGEPLHTEALEWIAKRKALRSELASLQTV